MKTTYLDGDVATTIHLTNDERLVIETVQDVAPYLERNRQMAKSDGYSKSREWQRVASIPNVIIEKWMREDGANIFAMSSEEFSKFIARKLADPDYQYLKTSGKTTNRVVVGGA